MEILLKNNIGICFYSVFLDIEFKNEFDIEYKRCYSLPDYPRNFTLKDINVDSNFC